MAESAERFTQPDAGVLETLSAELALLSFGDLPESWHDGGIGWALPNQQAGSLRNDRDRQL